MWSATFTDPAMEAFGQPDDVDGDRPLVEREA